MLVESFFLLRFGCHHFTTYVRTCSVAVNIFIPFITWCFIASSGLPGADFLQTSTFFLSNVKASHKPVSCRVCRVVYTVLFHRDRILNIIFSNNCSFPAPRFF
jgi:hypothetical protein